MSADPTSKEGIIGALCVVVGGLLTKAIDAVLGRKPAEVRALGDTIAIMAEQQSRFDRRLDHCEASHEACERGRREDRQEIDALKALIGGRVAGYHLNAPKGDPGRGEGR